MTDIDIMEVLKAFEENILEKPDYADQQKAVRFFIRNLYSFIKTRGTEEEAGITHMSFIVPPGYDLDGFVAEVSALMGLPVLQLKSTEHLSKQIINDIASGQENLAVLDLQSRLNVKGLIHLLRACVKELTSKEIAEESFEGLAAEDVLNELSKIPKQLILKTMMELFNAAPIKFKAGLYLEDAALSLLKDDTGNFLKEALTTGLASLKTGNGDTRIDIDFTGSMVISRAHLGWRELNDPHSHGLRTFFEEFEDVRAASVLKNFTIDSGEDTLRIFPDWFLERVSFFTIFDKVSVQREVIIVKERLEKLKERLAEKHGVPVEIEEPDNVAMLIMLATQTTEQDYPALLESYADQNIFNIDYDGKLPEIQEAVYKIDPDSPYIDRLLVQKPQVLIVDDEIGRFKDAYEATLGETVTLHFSDGKDIESVIKMINTNDIDFVLLDLEFGNVESSSAEYHGLDILKALRDGIPDLPVYIHSVYLKNDSVDRDEFSQGLYRQCIKLGGSAGMVDKMIDSQEPDQAGRLKTRMEEISLEIRFDRKKQNLPSENKELKFDVNSRVENGALTFLITGIREERQVQHELGIVVQRERIEYPEKGFSDFIGNRELVEDLKIIAGNLFSGNKQTTYKYVAITGPEGGGKGTLVECLAGEFQVPLLKLSLDNILPEAPEKDKNIITNFINKAGGYKKCVIWFDQLNAWEQKHAGFRAEFIIDALDDLEKRQKALIVFTFDDRDDVRIPNIILKHSKTRVCELPALNIDEKTEIIKKLFEEEEVPCSHFSSEDWTVITKSLNNVFYEKSTIFKILDEIKFISFKENLEIDLTVFRKGMLSYFHGYERQADNIEDLERPAYHEVGHAISLIYHKEGGHEPGEEELVKRIENINLINIFQYKTTSGFVQPLNIQVNTKDDFKREISISMGGALAEEIKFNTVSRGMLGDIERITSMARDMVAVFCMDNPELLRMNLYPSYFSSEFDKKTNFFSEKKKAEIDDRIDAVLKEIKSETRKILEDNWDTVEKLAEALLEKKLLFSEDIKALLGYA